MSYKIYKSNGFKFDVGEKLYPINKQYYKAPTFAVVLGIFKVDIRTNSFTLVKGQIEKRINDDKLEICEKSNNQIYWNTLEWFPSENYYYLKIHQSSDGKNWNILNIHAKSMINTECIFYRKK